MKQEDETACVRDEEGEKEKFGLSALWPKR